MFLRYINEKCIKQVLGIDTLALTVLVAPVIKNYELKLQIDLKSSEVAYGYVEESEVNKIKNSKTIVRIVNEGVNTLVLSSSIYGNRSTGVSTTCSVNTMDVYMTNENADLNTVGNIPTSIISVHSIFI